MARMVTPKLQNWKKNLGELPPTATQLSPSGGKHLVFRTDTPMGRHITKDPESPFFGLDVLGAKSFCVASPSVNAKGQYQWKSGELPEKDHFALLPEAWQATLESVCTVADNDERARAAQYTVSNVMKDLPEREPLGVDDQTLAEIEAALTWIPATGSDEPANWFKILGAIKHAANDQRGFSLALEWSAATNADGEQAYQYAGDDDVAYHWSRASERNSAELDDSTYSSIFWEAKHYGYTNNGRPCHFNVNTDGEMEPEFKVARLSDAGSRSDIKNSLPLTEAEKKEFEHHIDPDYFDFLEGRKLKDNTPSLLRIIARNDVLGSIARYIESTNSSPQPAIACLAALVIFSMLTNRMYIGCTELGHTRNNMMTLAVASSGAGKDASLKAGSKIANLVGAGSRVGAESKSSSGYHAQLQNSHNLYLAVDEFGLKLGQMNNAKSTQATILEFLLKVFTSSGDDDFQGIEYAPSGQGNNIESIAYPHVNVLGVGTPDSIYGNLNQNNLEGGYLGRILLYEAPSGLPEIQLRDPDKKELEKVKQFAEDLTAVKQASCNPQNLLGACARNPLKVQIDGNAFELLKSAAHHRRHEVIPQLMKKGSGLIPQRTATRSRDTEDDDDSILEIASVIAHKLSKELPSVIQSRWQAKHQQRQRQLENVTEAQQRAFDAELTHWQINFDELVAESCITALPLMQNWDPNKGSLRQYLWKHMQGAARKFIATRTLCCGSSECAAQQDNDYVRISTQEFEPDVHCPEDQSKNAASELDSDLMTQAIKNLPHDERQALAAIYFDELGKRNNGGERAVQSATGVTAKTARARADRAMGSILDMVPAHCECTGRTFRDDLNEHFSDLNHRTSVYPTPSTGNEAGPVYRSPDDKSYVNSGRAYTPEEIAEFLRQNALA